MNRFLRLSIDGSKLKYKFDTYDCEGVILIDTDDDSIKIVEKRPFIDGGSIDDSNLKKLLYYAKKNLAKHKYPLRYTYAWC